MNFIRLTAVIDGRFVESERHLDSTDQDAVSAVLEQAVADVRSSLWPEPSS